MAEEKTEVLTAETVAPPKEPGASALVPMGERGIALRSLEDLIRFARMAVTSGAAPKGMTEGAAAIAIQAGLERGLGLMGGLQQCVVINGVVSWRGQAALALIRNSGTIKPGTLHSWVEGEGDERRGVAIAWRIGDKEHSRREFSVKDAKRAGLWGKQGPWQQFPDGQLEWRAVGLLGRFHFSDVLGGFPLAEEAQDFVDIAPERPPARGELPPPPSPDPLFDAIEGEVASEPLPRGDGFEIQDPPFASHAEADRELAEEEQAGLFEKKA